MAHKDSLTLYNEFVANGMPEAQAQIQAHQMGDLADEMGGRYNELSEKLNETNKKLDSTIHELNAKLDIAFSKINISLKWMMLIGGAMAASFFSNIIFLKMG